MLTVAFGGGLDLKADGGRYFVEPKPGVDPLSCWMRVRFGPQQLMEWDISPPARPSKPVHALPTSVLQTVPVGTRVELSVAGVLAALRDLPLITHSIAGTVGLPAVPTAQTDAVPAAELLAAPDEWRRDARLRGSAQTAFGDAGANTIRTWLDANATQGALLGVKPGTPDRLLPREHGGRPKWITRVRNLIRTPRLEWVQVYPVSSQALRDIDEFLTGPEDDQLVAVPHVKIINP